MENPTTTLAIGAIGGTLLLHLIGAIGGTLLLHLL